MNNNIGNITKIDKNFIEVYTNNKFILVKSENVLFSKPKINDKVKIIFFKGEILLDIYQENEVPSPQPSYKIPFYENPKYIKAWIIITIISLIIPFKFLSVVYFFEIIISFGFLISNIVKRKQNIKYYTVLVIISFLSFSISSKKQYNENNQSSVSQPLSTINNSELDNVSLKWIGVYGNYPFSLNFKIKDKNKYTIKIVKDKQEGDFITVSRKDSKDFIKIFCVYRSVTYSQNKIEKILNTTSEKKYGGFMVFLNESNEIQFYKNHLGFITYYQKDKKLKETFETICQTIDGIMPEGSEEDKIIIEAFK